MIFDDISLGSARMKGIQTAESDLIMFIDSDIQISPRWFSEMIAKWRLLDNLYDGKLGMLYGRTIDPDRKVGKLKLWKMHREFCKGEWRAIEKGMRAFTFWSDTNVIREIDVVFVSEIPYEDLKKRAINIAWRRLKKH